MINLVNLDPDTHYFEDSDRIDSCMYYSTDSFNLKFVHNKNLLVLHLNIRSLAANWDELTSYLSCLQKRPSVLVVSETWLDSSSLHYCLPSFKSFHTIRQRSRGGGVSIFVDETMNVELLDSISFTSEWVELCSVGIGLKNEKINIIGVYRPPSSNLRQFNDEFFSLIEPYSRRTKCLIIGDLNVNLASTNPCDNELVFVENFQSLHFLPVINRPTRVTNASSSVIDHIWYNSLDNFEAGIFDVDISDHYPVFIDVNRIPIRNELFSYKFRSLTEGNIQNFINGTQLFLADFAQVSFPDVSSMCNVLCDNLYKIYNQHCPILTKQLSAKRLRNPWISRSLLSCIKHKHILGKQAKLNPSLLHDYRLYRNSLSTAIRSAKLSYFHAKFKQCMGDAKQTWKEINKIMKPINHQSRKIELSDNYGNLVPISDVPDSFNRYFSNVAAGLAGNIPNTNEDPLAYTPRIPNSFTYFDTNAAEVSLTIMSFKSKKSDLLSIPNFIFKRISFLLSPIMAEMINTSLSTGIFPDVLKIAKVVPIFKSGDKKNKSNFRPISVLNFVSKVFERIIYKRFICFFEKFGIICSQQFGFLKNCSTSDAILEFTEKIYQSLNNRKYFISVFLDFSKAFDTVNHQILLRKLSASGIRGSTLRWVESYLLDRKQYVFVNGIGSSFEYINSGVPQGSILGPLLFLIYINDMYRCMNHMSCIHYADDTSVFLEAESVREMELKVNADLVKMHSWLCSNKLSLNASKSSYMLFTNKIIPNDIIIKFTSIYLVSIYL